MTYMEHPAIWDQEFMRRVIGAHGYCWGDAAHWSGWTFDAVVEYAFSQRGGGFYRWAQADVYGFDNGDGKGLPFP